MAQFEKKKIDLTQINGGNRYENGDGVQAETINAVVEGVALAQEEVEKKQDTLVSGENIATINGKSLLDGGDITIEGGGSATVETDKTLTIENAPADAKTVGEKLEGKLNKPKLPVGYISAVGFSANSTTPKLIGATTTPASSALVLFTDRNTLRTSTPTREDDCTNKKYVDGKVKKYQHTIQVHINGYISEGGNALFGYIWFNIPSSSAIKMVKEQVIDWVNSLSQGTNIVCNGYDYDGETEMPNEPIMFIVANLDGSDIAVNDRTLSTFAGQNISLTDSSVEITDTAVIEF